MNDAVRARDALVNRALGSFGDNVGVLDAGSRLYLEMHAQMDDVGSEVLGSQVVEAHDAWSFESGAANQAHHLRPGCLADQQRQFSRNRLIAFQEMMVAITIAASGSACSNPAMATAVPTRAASRPS